MNFSIVGGGGGGFTELFNCWGDLLNHSVGGMPQRITPTIK